MHSPLTDSDPRRVIVICLGTVIATLMVLLGACPIGADTLDALVVTSAAADIWTTEHALQHLGLHEANPLLQTPGARIGAKGAAVALILVAKHKLQKKHKTAAKIVGWGAVVLWSGAAVNNALVSRRNK